MQQSDARYDANHNAKDDTGRDSRRSELKAITLRNIPPDLQKILVEKAECEGLSLNKVVLRMLEEAAGLSADRFRVHRELDDLAGTWATDEADRFDASIVDQRWVDEEIWT